MYGVPLGPGQGDDAVLAESARRLNQGMGGGRPRA
jgi:hypothetical protein